MFLSATLSDVGCQDNIIKGRISDDIFKIERTGDKLVKGTDCFERSVLPTKAMRKSLMECVETDFSKASVKAAISEIGSNEENPRCVAIKGMLQKSFHRVGQRFCDFNLASRPGGRKFYNTKILSDG